MIQRIILLVLVVIVVSACNKESGEVSGYITKIDTSNDMLLVGENDENKWNKKKPLVFWIKVGKEDIGKYAVGNKIKSTFHGPLSATLPVVISPDSIQTIDKLGASEQDALINELKHVETPSYFIKDMTLNKSTQTLQVELYNFEGQRLNPISIQIK